MLKFKPLGLEDIAVVRPFFDYAVSRTCDYTVGGLFMWRDYYQAEYALFHDTLVIKELNNEGKPCFMLPLGPDIHAALAEIDQYCAVMDIPVAFCTMTDDDVAMINSYFPIQELPEPDWGDYLYAKEELLTLAGRKFHGKRNDIDFFKKSHPGYTFTDLTEQDIPQVKEFYLSSGLIDEKNSQVFKEEQAKVFEVLDHNDVYGMLGGVLRSEGTIRAFSMGEIVKDTLYVHIEKADHKIKGACEMISHEFAKRFADERIQYINWEEDVGDMGLRQSKLSYHPCRVIPKYTVLPVAREAN
ncbi:MAG: phosphatidylglycerol lysyltransferase domain-containing protein [Sphaerochaeta sp.]|nr:phosphatidylglycerol lysyltransferase domain-containing protein [Sphaerochaeta sp.]